MHDIDLSHEPRIRPLVSAEVFCPKCGKHNSFKLSSQGKMLNYFCDRCNRRLNDIWETYKENKIDLILCGICQEWTFKDQSYCINCGRKVIITEPDLVEKVFDLEEIEEEKKELKKRYLIVLLIL